MSQSNAYVITDPTGVMRVGASGVPLESVVIAYHDGHSPESIRSQYPALTLEEIYGSIAFYLANKEMVLEYLKRLEVLWEQLKAKVDADPSPVVQRLRALKASGAKTT